MALDKESPRDEGSEVSWEAPESPGWRVKVGWEWGFKFQMQLQPEGCWALGELLLTARPHNMTDKGVETDPVGSQGRKWFFLPLPRTSALWS